MAAICQWNCSDNYVDDFVDTQIKYTSSSGEQEWLPLHNGTETALYPPASMGMPPSLSAYKGAGGRATFSFLGQEVAVYGSEFGRGTQSSYTLDGDVAAVYTSQSVGIGVRLFYAGVLSATAHTLVIDVVKASEASPFTLDWIEYNNTARGAKSTPSPAPSQSPASASSSAGASTVSALSAGHASKASFSVAAIAGIVVGGLVGLTAIVLTYLALRSRRRWQMGRDTKYEYGEVAQYDSDNLVMPPADGQAAGSTPTILVTHADDTTSLRNVGTPSACSVSTSNRPVPGSVERRTANELGNSKRESYSEGPPAYAP